MQSKGSMSDEIAIIGVGCRFPGATCLEEFWDVLAKGENHVVDIPPERWNMDAFFDSDVNAAGKSYARRAGLIENFDHFDKKLFKINETEAAQMDPQQRQVLECTYMALEDAGITRQQIAGQKVGVFIGNMAVDYGLMISAASPDVSNYTVTGQAGSIISNRVSFVYNLTGPSMTLDTACSSSIVAIHQAGLALKAGDCSMAICGGVTLLLHPSYFIKLCKARMLSPTGQCHAFSANADGYTRGEGCGIVIVKLLSQALHDGDNIWGTIVTGLNQDGRQVTPITAPSGKQQQELLNDIYTRHGIDPTEVDYIEAHGTGTRRGDPVEATALGTFFEKFPRQRHIGSVKTNIGHLEAAAGVAGLIKVLLMMKHNTIVRSLHFDKPNKDIDFDRYQFVVPVENVDWKREKKIACINSFGFGGSNSHAVLRSYSVERLGQCNETDEIVPVCFSGFDYDTLHKSISQFFKHHGELQFKAMAYTSCVCREHLDFRKVFFSDTYKDLKLQIESQLSNISPTPKKDKGRIIFVFCGMGTAWVGMCNDHMKCSKCFLAKMQEIEDCLYHFVNWSLIKRLRANYDVTDPLFGPIAIFACQVSLAHLWESWGVKPAAVVGQSVGEVAAAHIAGILSLYNAVRIILQRTRILAMVPSGKMMLIRNVDIERVKTACRKHHNQAVVALHYSPVTCTISGDERAVLSVKEELGHISDSNTLFHELPVTRAFHSPFMASSTHQLDKILFPLQTSKMATEFISSVDPGLNEEAIRSVTYWGRNIREPVRFCDAIMKAARNLHNNIFVEIGPKPVLNSHIRDIFKHTSLDVTTVSSIHKGSKYTDMYNALSVLYTSGVSIRWNSFFDEQMQPTSYPAHVFNGKPVLLVSDTEHQMLMGRTENSGGHLFLKGTVESGSARLIIDPNIFKSVFEHKVKGAIILPGAVYAEAALAIAKRIALNEHKVVNISVSFKRLLNLHTTGHITNIEIKDNTDNIPKCVMAVTIRKGTTEYAEAVIRQTLDDVTPDRLDVPSINDRCKHTLTKEDVYEKLEKAGFNYGVMMSVIQSSQVAEKESLTLIDIGSQLGSEMELTVLHPAVLDGMFQAAVTVATNMKEMLPFFLKGLVVKKKISKNMLVHVKVLQETETHATFSLSLLTMDGYVIAHIAAFTLKVIGVETFNVRDVAYEIQPRAIDHGVSVYNSKTFQDVLMFSDGDSSLTSGPWRTHDISTLLRNSFPLELQQASTVVVLFQAMPEKTEDGLYLERYLEDKIMPLRSLILYISEKFLKIPILIMTKTTPVDLLNANKRHDAQACINEGIQAFIRCVRREFPRMVIKLLKLMEDSDTCLQAVINGVLQIQNYPEIEMNNKQFYGQVFDPVKISTPHVRPESQRNGMGTILVSKTSETITEPFFTLSREASQMAVKEVRFTTHSIAVHNTFLTEQVLCADDNEDNPMTYPVLTYESSGTIETSDTDITAVICYPHLVIPKTCVPQKFVMDLKDLKNYETGSLLKLYCLWRLCDQVMKETAILYTRQTKKYAESMKVLLLAKHSQPVVLLTPDEIPSHHGSPVVISTIQITAELAQMIVRKWHCLEHIVCFKNMMKTSILKLVKRERLQLKVSIVRSLEILSFSEMETHIPKLYMWIKDNSRSVDEIFLCFKSVCDSSLVSQFLPIDLTEFLKTKEWNIYSDASLHTEQVGIPENMLFDKTGMYLVVGGLTGLGWECVLYLASKGAGCVAMLSRRHPNDDKQADIEQISKDYGCSVTSVQADVQDISALKSALSELKTSFPMFSLKGVFFGAAVLDDGLLPDMTREKFYTASSPKVTGSWNLHLLTEHLPLDYFVLFSSVTSVFGNAGQSNYGAGNGFMDGLAHVRNKNGQSGQTVNWGPLRMGMLQEKNIKILESYGYKIIQKKNIPECLKHVLMLNKPQVVICELNLTKFEETLQRENNPDFASRFRLLVSPSASPVRPASHPTWNLKEFRKISKDEAMLKLMEYVKAVVIEVAMLDETAIDVEQGTRELGVDSMNFIHITTQIRDDTHVQLSPTTLIVENATVSQISRYIYEQLRINVQQE
ncbi:phenolphthiocerol synthesis polyketide synthase type I Pks15/1-like isoform X2 [Haliotis rufescens]|uniref:phenolphthiocerol synthesis polyketide synthase type I Pks15/1-like isoform X2 n=2 Tax=Haliotis rufescens TaxID=6454 RepID=UPI00201EDE92|nr:phenolphthiocerol synthesis polyketide synthase type I Pks15/1-like isoform X2 [Haliotis rufescens]XP_048239501.1 phenolphthiocerol synthesis polyketide synthase type I Pks15/1-like isoform X2 [Haliotis rufescens]